MESDSMLSPDSVLSFSQNGFVVVRSVVELRRIKELRAAHDELVVRWAAECEVSVDEYERVVSQWTNLHEQHPSFHAQIHHPQVIPLARICLVLRAFNFSTTISSVNLRTGHQLSLGIRTIRTGPLTNPKHSLAGWRWMTWAVKQVACSLCQGPILKERKHQLIFSTRLKIGVNESTKLSRLD